MKIANLKIGIRLGMAFGLITLLGGILGTISFNAFTNIGNTWEDFSSISLQKRDLASQGEFKLGDAVHHFKNYLLRGQDYDKKFSSDLDGITSIIASYKKMSVSSREQKLLDEIGNGVDAYRVAMKKVVELKTSGTAIEEIDKSVNGADKVIIDAFNGLIAIAREEAAATGESLSSTISAAENLIIALTVTALIVSALCAWLATRSITTPMNEAVLIARTVATGDLTCKIDVRSTDETGQLLQALKDMNTSLLTIVGQVRGGTDAIATASGQIASGNLDLSSRTEQQASSLEETASAMEELTTTVKHNGDNARQANTLAMSASEVAVRGGDVVLQVVETMGSINESARKIVDIIGVIDGIAFQTNILALNAAVEAARAGEQGRGFAVVASEVRNLAQRSASAAKEIKQLIGDSVEKVDAGSKLVNQAGRTMDDIVASVKRVTDIMGDITSAGQEQEAGIGQINQAIAEMDVVTQQNAALVEEAAAAAESLSDQADKLLQAVSVFKLDDVLAQAVGIQPRVPHSKIGRSKVSGVPVRKQSQVRLASNDRKHVSCSASASSAASNERAQS